MPAILRAAVGALVLSGLSALSAPVASAQLTVTTDLGLFSRFEWRGLTFTNRPVAQPDLIVSLARGTSTVTVGGWSNVELAGYDGPRDISVTAGLDGASPTAWAAWGEASRTVGRVTLTGGVNVYAYPTTNGIAARYNTVEPLVRVALAAPLAPRVSVYQDVGKIRGTFVEGSLSQAVPVGGTRALLLAATAGWSVGEALDEQSSQTAYFGHNGLAAVDVAASLTLPAGRFAVTPAVHLTAARDPWTRVTAPGETHGMKLWAGTTVSWAAVAGRP